MHYPGIDVVATILSVLYGWCFFVALTNLIFMPRPRKGAVPIDAAVLIPARDEKDNLAVLVPALRAQGARVYVYDDESTDRTAEVAATHGAIVIRASGPPPEGWTGKNRACHALALAAAEDFSGEWILFLDADTRPGPGFMSGIASLVEREGPKLKVLTGFPRFLPGRGLEPIFLGWVTWSLLALNPFGLVALTKLGHNRFLNGQVSLWRVSTYFELIPHEQVRGKVLEDIEIGRFLSRKKIPVSTANLSRILDVQMYIELRSAWNGMLKNSCDIAGIGIGSIGLATFFFVLSLGWIGAAPFALQLAVALIASALFVDLTVRRPLWFSALISLSLAAGGMTILWSNALRRRGGTSWKGRIVGTSKPD